MNAEGVVKRIQEMEKEMLPDVDDDWTLEKVDKFVTKLKELLREWEKGERG